MSPAPTPGQAARTVEAVQVMAAALGGARIEWRVRRIHALPSDPGTWQPTRHPCWDWNRCEYRVAH